MKARKNKNSSRSLWKKSFIVSFALLLIIGGSLFLWSSFKTEAAIGNGAVAVNLAGQIGNDGLPGYTRFGNDNGTNPRGFYNPGFTAIDTTGHRLFVSDTSNNRVLVYNLNAGTNLLDEYTPDFVLGQANFYDNSLDCVANGLDGPTGLLFAGNNLYVSDTDNNRILIFDVASITNGEDAANVLGQTGFTSCSASSATQSTLRTPKGLTYDSVNSLLFVADSYYNRVMIFNIAAVANGENAVNVLGQTSFTTSDYWLTPGGLRGPGDVLFDGTTRLFVADSYYNRVLVFNVAIISDGENAVNVLGQTGFTAGDDACTQAGLDDPAGLAYDSTNQYLFVANNDDARVLVFDVAAISDGEGAINFLGDAADFTSCNSGTDQDGLGAVIGLNYVASTNSLYVGDSGNHRVMIFDTTAIVNGEDAVNTLGHVDSSNNPKYSEKANGGAYKYGFNNPSATVVDTTHHRLFVADYDNNRVLVFNLNATTNKLDDYQADNVLGQANFVDNDYACTQSRMRTPAGLAYDSSLDFLFVGEYDNSRVLVYDVATISDGENAAYVLGEPNFTECAGSATQSTIESAWGVDYDAANERLFVADRLNSRVVVFDISGGIFGGIVNGEAAINVLGQADFTSSGNGTTQSTLYWPQGVTFDGTNNRVYVADSLNKRVMVFDATPNDSNCATPNDGICNGENAAYVLGQTGFTSSTAACTAAGMNRPIGLDFDSDHNRLYVADENYDRVTTYDVATITNGESATYVLGQGSFTSCSSSTVTSSSLDEPASVYYESSNQYIYVPDPGWPAESGSNRVMAFDASDPVSITARETADLDGDGYIDAMHITFNNNITDSTVTIGNFAIVGASGLAFSSTTNGDTANDKDIYITFTDGVLDSDSIPALTYTAGTLQDVYTNALATNGPTASTDKAGAAIISAIAGDGTDLQTGIDADDTVTITFSENTTQPAITALNINTVLALSGGHSWRDGANAIGSAAWSNAYTLVVTLSIGTSLPTVAVLDTITLNGTTILDGSTNNSSVIAFSSISGTFTAPAGGHYVPPPPPPPPPVVYQCSDGNDNDGDGLVDYPNDLGCASATDNNEFNTPACSDGIDNDNDGKIDYPADVGCASQTDDNEAGHPQCSDGLDNDNDGKIDYPNDLGCLSLADNDESDHLGTLTIQLPDGAVTNKPFPKISGTAVGASDAVIIYIDNKQIDSVISDSNRSYSWTSLKVFADGQHEIYVKEGTAQSDKLILTIDTLPPEKPIIDAVVVNSQESAATKMNAGITLTGKSVADVKYLMVYVDNEIVKIFKPAAISWTLNLSDELSIGNHVLSVKTVDQANNFADVIPQKAFIVTDQLFYQCNNGKDDDGDGKKDYPSDAGCSSATDNDEKDTPVALKAEINLIESPVSNNNTPEIKGTTLAGTATVDIYVDGVKAGTVISGGDKSFTWKSLAALADGMHEFYVKVGTQLSDSQLIFLDTVEPISPTLETIKIPAQKLVNNLVSAEIDLRGGLGAGAKYVLLYLDDNLVDRFIPEISSWSYKLYQALAPGSHKMAVKSMDEAGNLSSSLQEQSFVIEKIELAQCDNEIDDDNDDLIDLADPGCNNAKDNSEDSDVFVAAGQTVAVAFEPTLTILNMPENSAVSFTKEKTEHSLALSSVNALTQSADMIISSAPIQLRLRVGETKQIDFDADGFLDIEVRLIKILPNNRAVITIKKINQKIVLPKEEEKVEIIEVPIEPLKDNQVDIQINENNVNNAGGNNVNVGNGGGAGGGRQDPNRIAALVAGANASGGALPAALDAELVQNPQMQALAAGIDAKNEWDKSAQERNFEVLFSTEQFVQSASVQKVADATANVLANVLGVDAKQAKQNIESGVRTTVKTAKVVNKATLDNPVAEKVNAQTKTPVMTTVTATSVASVATVGTTGASGASAVTYIQFALSQSLMLFVRKRREKWGVVYNAATKQPIDLAIVRVYDSATNKLLRTKVTDKQGRYHFLLKPGKYYIQVNKKEFRFPSRILENAKNDGKFENVYYGHEFEMNEEDSLVRPIAMDPHKKFTAEKSLVKLYLVRKGQFVLTLVGPIVAVTSFLINPQWWVGGTVVAQLGLYVIFRRLGIGEKPKSWGTVQAIPTKEKIARAIVRVFDTRFNKLLETQVTDGRGRYAFLVGNQEYYMTAEKGGYFQTRTNRYNLEQQTAGYLIDDLYLKKQNLDEKAIAAIEKGQPVTIRTDLGRQTEKIIDGVKKVVRRDEEKFAGELPEVDLEEMHEDYYALDSVK